VQKKPKPKPKSCPLSGN